MPRRSSVAVALPATDFTLAIAERAYYKAERRGFAPGHELDDWLAAEREMGAFPPKAPVAAKAKRPAAPRKSATVSKTKASKTK